MQTIDSPGVFRRSLAVFLVAGLVMPAPNLAAPTGMVALEDDEMAGVSGAGLAFAFDDFRFQMAPTSYFEQIGAPSHPATTFNTGDYRWIGTTISSGGTENLFAFHDYVGLGGNPVNPTSSSCSTALSPLGCPIAQGGARGYAEVNNPFVLRVRDYSAVGRTGGHADPNTGWTPGQINTVAELVGPTASSPFRWSFWGEVEASNSSGTLGVMQNQNIIIGAPVSRLRPHDPGTLAGPVFRLYQNMTDQSLGMIYHHRLSGDYRFSVNQNGVSAVDGWSGSGVPHFTSQEGMYFINVNAYLPLGQLHYQSMILNAAAAQDGNFAIELTRLPNNSNAFNDFYSAAGATGFERNNRSERYYETHGYVRWGDAFPTNSNSNGLGGSGVSQVRYSGVDPDGPTRVVNSTNFPASTCQTPYGPGVSGNQNGPCATWSNATVGNVVVGASDRSTILTQGGMVFMSRDGSATWQVVNNQNRAANNNLHMLTVAWNGSIQLQRDSRYNDYNPTLNVNAINLGSSRVEGMMINHLRISTLGAAN